MRKISIMENDFTNLGMSRAPEWQREKNDLTKIYSKGRMEIIPNEEKKTNIYSFF